MLSTEENRSCFHMTVYQYQSSFHLFTSQFVSCEASKAALMHHIRAALHKGQVSLLRADGVHYDIILPPVFKEVNMSYALSYRYNNAISGS